MTVVVRVPRSDLPRAGLFAVLVGALALVGVIGSGLAQAPPEEAEARPDRSSSERFEADASAHPEELLAAAPARGAVQDPSQSEQPAQGEAQEGEPQQDQAQEGETTAEGQQGTSVDVVLSADEEAAMQLIRRILEEEEGVRMGRDFDYDPAGRRDPFRSLLEQVSSNVAPPDGARPFGLAGFLVSEVEVKIIARAQGRWMALLQGPDQKTYPVEVGSELYDGHVREIHNNTVVFEQVVEDLMGARRTREVTKTLRDIGGGSESRP